MFTYDIVLLLDGIRAGDVLSGAWAVLRWLGGALVWLLDHGLLVALATGVAAWIAWQAHQREERRAREREASYDARVEPLAFSLYQDFLRWSWSEPTGPTESRAVAADSLDEAEGLEDRVRELAVLVPNASEEKSQHVQKAVAGYYHAIGILRMIDMGVRMKTEAGEGEELSEEDRFDRGRALLWDRVEHFRWMVREHLHEASGDLARVVAKETIAEFAAAERGE